MGRPKLRLTQKDAQSLKSYEWPINIRELQNLFQRATITTKEKQLQLPSNGQVSTDLAREEMRDSSGELLTESQLRQLECPNVLNALMITNGKVSRSGGVAELFDIKASTLTSRMWKMNICFSREYQVPIEIAGENLNTRF